MKKIKLTLKTNDKLISEDVYSYKDEKYFKILKYEDIILKFKLSKKDFVFIRETKDDLFKIENNKGLVTLKEINQDFDIELSKCDFKQVDDTYYISYMLDGDDSLIEIIIKDL